jgi:hypothetical protein
MLRRCFAPLNRLTMAKSRKFRGSKKTGIIETFFRQRWDEANRVLRNPVVTLDEVHAAIRQFNAPFPDIPENKNKRLNEKNPANFIKDFIRNRVSGNRNWPSFVHEQRYTARQIKGDGRCFEFIPFVKGQLEPFPNNIPGPTENTRRIHIQSVSLPLPSRRLGRTDEPWLVQVLARLQVLETHLALVSDRPVLQLDYLQTNVKLRRSEIDALLLAIESTGIKDAPTRELIVCFEAKGITDDILEDQILSHVEAAFKMKVVVQDLVLPIAAKAIGRSEVHVIEFDVISRAEIETLENLTIKSEAVYVLEPAVPGIGK